MLLLNSQEQYKVVCVNENRVGILQHGLENTVSIH